MLEEMPQRDTSEWVAHIHEIRDQHIRKQQYNRPDTDMFMPHDVFDTLTRIVNSSGAYRICTDVGQNQMWAAQLIEWLHPDTHITSGGLGTMGFALPAAIGAQVARPEETVWAIAGDGGFQMNIQELATIVQEQLPVKIAIINNGYLGMVRQWQELFHDRRYSATPMWSPDFIKVAEAYGIPAIRVNHQSQVEDAINAAYATSGPMLIEFQVEREVNVYPMVAPGSSIGDMITESPMITVDDWGVAQPMGGR
jgi:acetolactate synthase-1/2/3 large subunit